MMRAAWWSRRARAARLPACGPAGPRDFSVAAEPRSDGVCHLTCPFTGEHVVDPRQLEQLRLRRPTRDLARLIDGDDRVLESVHEQPRHAHVRAALTHAVDAAEIRDFIGRFAFAAGIAKQTGFTGVQIHAAHGYLISSFLSPVTNRRDDEWGGSLENRARFLLETIRATRAEVGPDFPVSIKLNSDDFRKGGFSHADCLQVVEMLNAEGIDLLEISGGTYEQPRLLGFEGKADSLDPDARTSTRQREAYFLDYARSIRKIAKMPLMVTGGFRTPAFIEEVLAAGHCDVIGIGRPMTTDMDLPGRWLAGESSEAIRHENRLKLSERRWLSGSSPIFAIKILNIFGAQAWYYQQLQRIADGRGVRMTMGVLEAFFRYFLDEIAQARRVHRARKQRA